MSAPASSNASISTTSSCSPPNAAESPDATSAPPPRQDPRRPRPASARSLQGLDCARANRRRDVAGVRPPPLGSSTTHRTSPGLAASSSVSRSTSPRLSVAVRSAASGSSLPSTQGSAIIAGRLPPRFLYSSAANAAPAAVRAIAAASKTSAFVKGLRNSTMGGPPPPSTDAVGKAGTPQIRASLTLFGFDAELAGGFNSKPATEHRCSGSDLLILIVCSIHSKWRRAQRSKPSGWPGLAAAPTMAVALISVQRFGHRAGTAPGRQR